MTIDSSISALPSTTSPSAGTLPPGLTSTTSSTSNSLTDTDSVPSSVTRSASSGSSSASASRAPRAWPIERISIQWPSSITVMSRPSSHQNSRSNRSRLLASDAPKATVMAIPISNIIPGSRRRTSR